MTVVVAVRAPEVPVMVTVAAAKVAVLLTVSVSTLVPVVGLVAKAAVTPLGRPDAARVTLPVNPFTPVTVIVSVALIPGITDRLAAEGVSVKPGAWTTVSVMVLVTVTAPEVPVMVMMDLPTVAVLLAVSVSTLFAVVGLGANTAVTPLGRPDAASVTLPVNPPPSVIVMVSLILAPCTTDSAGFPRSIGGPIDTGGYAS